MILNKARDWGMSLIWQLIVCSMWDIFGDSIAEWGLKICFGCSVPWGGNKILQRFKCSSQLLWSQENFWEAVVANLHQIFTRSHAHTDLKIHCIPATAFKYSLNKLFLKKIRAFFEDFYKTTCKLKMWQYCKLLVILGMNWSTAPSGQVVGESSPKQW